MGTVHNLSTAVTKILSSAFDPSLLEEVPSRWVIHGNCALLPPSSFTSPAWKDHPQVFQEISKILKVTTIARQSGPIHNSYRQPSSPTILFTSASSYDEAIIARKKENGIHYEWDITKVMFSPGNISEKQRLAKFDLQDSVVVDLFAGIGYFSLTLLIHCRAKFLYACEWNPDAIHWLQNNLKRNKIDPSRYAILQGDNRTTAPVGVADHVNLGLIPSSESSWKVGVASLRRDVGGVLHVHGNVDLDLNKNDNNHKDEDSIPHENNEIKSNKKDRRTLESWQRWSDHVETSINQILEELYVGEGWTTEVMGIFKVKSFGPRVDHLVIDLMCKPCTSNNVLNTSTFQ